MFSSPIRTIAGGAVLLLASACGGASSSSGSSLPAMNVSTHRLHGAAASSIPEAGILFVADYVNNDVAVLTTGVPGAPADLIAHGTITKGVTKPTVVTTDAAGDLFVGNAGDNTIKEYANGSVTPALTIQKIYYPQGIAIDAQGNLWVSQLSSPDALFPVVDEYAYSANAKTFASRPSKTITGSGAVSLLFPHGLAFDSKGDLFIADPGHAGILFELTPGSTNPNVVQLPTTPATIAEPFDVKIAGAASSQAMYISDFSGGEIVRLSLGASPQETWESRGTPASQPVNYPSYSAWLAVDGSGFVYCEQNNGNPRSPNLYDPPSSSGLGVYGDVGSGEGLAFTAASNFSVTSERRTKKELR